MRPTSLARIPAEVSNVVAIARGDSYAVVLNADGTVFSWTDAGTTQPQAPTGSNYVAVAAGGYASLALWANIFAGPDYWVPAENGNVQVR